MYHFFFVFFQSLSVLSQSIFQNSLGLLVLPTHFSLNVPQCLLLLPHLPLKIPQSVYGLKLTQHLDSFFAFRHVHAPVHRRQHEWRPCSFSPFSPPKSRRRSVILFLTAVTQSHMEGITVLTQSPNSHPRQLRSATVKTLFAHSSCVFYVCLSPEKAVRWNMRGLTIKLVLNTICYLSFVSASINKLSCFWGIGKNLLDKDSVTQSLLSVVLDL